MIQVQTNETTLTLTSECELVVTRQFNASPQTVFDAWTKPEHVKHWWGPFGMTMALCEIDLRTGGAFRFVLHDADGNEYGFGGTYYGSCRRKNLSTDASNAGHEAPRRRPLKHQATRRTSSAAGLPVARRPRQPHQFRDGSAAPDLRPGKAT